MAARPNETTRFIHSSAASFRSLRNYRVIDVFVNQMLRGLAEIQLDRFCVESTVFSESTYIYAVLSGTEIDVLTKERFESKGSCHSSC